MELAEFARTILTCPVIQTKVERPATAFTDFEPGKPFRIEKPARPDNLQFAPRRTAPSMPKPQAFHDQSKVAVAHHIMANHELQALEVMAMVMLAFPDVETEFRLGLAAIMVDEQRHTKMHIRRASELGLEFGDLPVNSYIWQKSMSYQSALQYIAGLPLVFEAANLDHTVELEAIFQKHGDTKSASIMKSIHNDEIQHVEFGMTWLRKWKNPDQSDFEAWQQNLEWPMRPSKARGHQFQAEARRKAGMDEEFVTQAETWIEDEDEQQSSRNSG